MFVLAGIEFSYRRAGHNPSVVDDKNLWCVNRERIYEGNPKTLVLLGDSRIQLGFSTDYFRSHFSDYTVVQLAVDGRGVPLAVLEDLANDDRFSGVVLCSLNMFFLIISDGQEDYVDYYHNSWTLDKKVNRMISCQLQNNAVIFNPNVNLNNFLNRMFATGKPPVPMYLTTFEDRSRLADYSIMNINHHRQFRVNRLLKFASAFDEKAKSFYWKRFLERTEKLNLYAQKLQNRGNRVVFVQFPSSDEGWTVEEKCVPKKQFWDRFASSTSAPTIHFQDVPSLQGYPCPDTSHLEGHDTPKFTGALMNELVLRGIISNQNFAQAE
jgi:hypothetical protein